MRGGDDVLTRVPPGSHRPAVARAPAPLARRGTTASLLPRPGAHAARRRPGGSPVRDTASSPTPFASIYPLYVAKAERKDRTQDEVDQVIAWLTGYDDAGLERGVADEVDLETFFAGPRR